MLFEGSDVELVAHSSIQGTLHAIGAGRAECAVVPVENSVEGTVPATLDTFWLLPSLRVEQALILPVRHCLIGRGTLGAINTVYSHPQALAQCQGWLEEHLGKADRLPTASTVQALSHIGPGAAAIASERAADLHCLPVLARTINDHGDNSTRFWLVTGEHLALGRGASTRTSIAFSLKQNCPGALLGVLAILSAQNINLAKIESRPTKKVIGEYLFFADLEGDAGQEPINSALQRIGACVAELRLLGSYPVLQVPVARS